MSLFLCVYVWCIISVGQLNPLQYKQKRIIIFIPNPSYFLLTGKYFRKSFQLAFHNHKWSRVRGWHVFVNFFTWWLFLKGFCCFKIVYLSTNKSFADALHCKYVHLVCVIRTVVILQLVSENWCCLWVLLNFQKND